MPTYLTLYTVPLLIATVLSGLVAVYAWRHRAAQSAVALSLLALTITEWSLGYAFEIAAPGLAAKIWWGKIQYIGIALLPVTWLVFTIRYALRGYLPHRLLMALTLIVPLITIGLAFTTESHGLLWKTIDLYQGPGLTALSVTYGPWFWVQSAYAYLLLLIGSVLVLRMLVRREALYRGQAAILLVTVLTPWLGNILYLSGLSPFPHLDLTPFTFTISVVGMAWAIFGYQLIKLSPLARDLLVDRIADGMIVVDDRGRVADINPAAGRIIGVRTTQALGKTFDELFQPWPEAIALFQQATETTGELVVGKGEASRRYELRITALRDIRERTIGRLIMLHDNQQGQLPAPRYATHEPRTQPLIQPQPSQPAPVRGPWQRLRAFLVTPVKTDLHIPAGINPKWYQARERSFTLILRTAALVGTLALLVAQAFSQPRVLLPFSMILVLIWFLGLARQVNFNTRTHSYLLLLYTMSIVELTVDGYTVESISLLMALIVSATLLLGRRGGLVVYLASVLTLAIYGVQIVGRVFVPLSSSFGLAEPTTLNRAVTALLVFSASGAALVAAVSILIESLNHAWQMETQARNLLQQERDLLEQRVQERTAALAKARDEAIQNGNELRQSFSAQQEMQDQILQQNDLMAKEISERIRVEMINEAFLRDIQALQAVHLKLSQVSSLNELYQQIVVLSQRHLGLDRVGLYILDETTNELCGTFGIDPHGNVRDEHSLREPLTEDHWFWRIVEADNKVLVADDGLIYDFHTELGQGVTTATVLWNGHWPIGCLVADNFIHHRKKRPYEAELISLLGNTFGHLIEQKNAENRLNDSEKRFRQLVENAGDIIYRVNGEGYLTYINPSGLRSLGYAESELLGRHYLDLVAPEARSEIEQFYDQQILSNTLNTYHELPVVTAGGNTIILGQNVQIVLQNEQFTAMQAQAHDITERKRMEDALALARDQALAASKVKSQMLSQVNHELRTPLGAILGYAELLRSGMFGEVNPQQHGALAEIIDSVNYQTDIVNDLLDTAQLEARKMSLQISPCRPREIFNQVETTLSVLAQKKNLQFTMQIAPDLPEQLLLDERRLSQILINLGGNAIKFTREGEVKISALCSSAAHWTIQVSDTGIGIPADAQAYIFEPFRQVSSSSTADQRGTGLGLSITRQLVELMGGTITLNSEPGNGSTFTVRLPILSQFVTDSPAGSAA